MNLSKFNRSGSFLMLALDHRGTFNKIFNLQNSDAYQKSEVILLKKQILRALQDVASGFLLDPEYGLPAYKELKINQPPFLLRIEKSSSPKKTKLGYKIEDLKSMGASGVKLLIYLNPEDKTRLEKLILAREVSSECDQYNLPLFLEIITYQNSIRKTSKANLVINSVKVILENAIKPAVFKLEYPGNATSCLQLTRILGPIPWVILTGGIQFKEFKSNLKIAVRNGAKGFLAGRGLWQEASLYSKGERIKFLNTKTKQRFKEISKIVEQNLMQVPN